jgi:hypothetical protein
VIDVARLGHPHHRVDQQVGLEIAGGPQRELVVGAVHGVSGLESDNLAPAQTTEAAPGLLGGQAEADEIVVGRQLDPLDTTADGDVVGALEEMGDTGVLAVEGAVDRLCLGLPVELPHVVDREDRQHGALGVAQRQGLALLQLLRHLLGDVEGDGERPQGAVGQPHLFAHRLEVGLTEKTGQRREAAIHEQLQITDLAWGEIPRGPLQRGLFELGAALVVDQQVDQSAAVWGVQMVHEKVLQFVG